MSIYKKQLADVGDHVYLMLSSMKTIRGLVIGYGKADDEIEVQWDDESSTTRYIQTRKVVICHDHD